MSLSQKVDTPSLWKAWEMQMTVIRSPSSPSQSSWMKSMPTSRKTCAFTPSLMVKLTTYLWTTIHLYSLPRISSEWRTVSVMTQEEGLVRDAWVAVVMLGIRSRVVKVIVDSILGAEFLPTLSISSKSSWLRETESSTRWMCKSVATTKADHSRLLSLASTMTKTQDTWFITTSKTCPIKNWSICSKIVSKSTPSLMKKMSAYTLTICPYRKQCQRERLSNHLPSLASHPARISPKHVPRRDEIRLAPWLIRSPQRIVSPGTKRIDSPPSPARPMSSKRNMSVIGRSSQDTMKVQWVWFWLLRFKIVRMETRAATGDHLSPALGAQMTASTRSSSTSSTLEAWPGLATSVWASLPAIDFSRSSLTTWTNTQVSGLSINWCREHRLRTSKSKICWSRASSMKRTNSNGWISSRTLSMMSKKT